MDGSIFHYIVRVRTSIKYGKVHGCNDVAMHGGGDILETLTKEHRNNWVSPYLKDQCISQPRGMASYRACAAYLISDI